MQWNLSLRLEIPRMCKEPYIAFAIRGCTCVRRNVMPIATAFLFACASNTETAQTVFIGKPGAPATGGAFTFASPMNYCRGVRWIISGTMASVWPDEPHPIRVRQGSSIQVLGTDTVSCGELDDRLTMVPDTNLIHYKSSDGDSDRYVREADTYTSTEYKLFSVHQQRMQAQHAAQVQKALTSRVKLPPPDIPPPMLVSGYEDGFQALMKTETAGDYPSRCNVAMANEYVDSARAALLKRHFDAARRLAYGAVEYTDRCHSDRDHPDRARGDGLLIFSKAEIRLGMLTAGKNDADAAAASYVECTTDNGYDADSVQYCEEHRTEANKIMKNG